MEAIDSLKDDPSSDWNNGRMNFADQLYGEAAREAFIGKMREYEENNNVGDPYEDPENIDEDDDHEGTVGDDDNPMAAPPISPLIIDLDGDGIELIARNQSTIGFDLDADGFKEHTGWTNGDDAFLALDRNSNGKIDDINQLIGGLGDDSLNGGSGDDILIGGIGSDNFQVSNQWGSDTVEDFEDGLDKLDFSQTDLTFEDLTINQLNLDVDISDLSGNSLLLKGMLLENISEADFMF